MLSEPSGLPHPGTQRPPLSRRVTLARHYDGNIILLAINTNVPINTVHKNYACSLGVHNPEPTWHDAEHTSPKAVLRVTTHKLNFK